MVIWMTRSHDIQLIASKYPEYIQQVKKNYLWNYILFILEASSFTVSLAMFSQETTLPYLISNITDRSIWIGVIPAIAYLGFYIPQIIGAYLVHAKKIRKWVLFWIAIIQRIATLFIALVVQSLDILPNPVILVLFLVAYSIFSLTNGFLVPPYADLINKTIIYNRGLFYSVHTGVTGVIGFLSSMLARYLLDHFPFPTNFQAMFWIAFAVSFVSPFIIAAFRESPYPEPKSPESLLNYFQAIPDMLRQYPKYVRYLFARSCIGIAFMANAFYAVYAVNHYNLEPGVIGVYTMVALMSKSIMGFLWGWLGDRFGYKTVMLGVAGTLCLQPFFALISPTASFFFLIILFIGSVNSAVWISDPNMIFEIAPPSETGRFIGMTNTIIGPVMVLAPLLGGVLIDLFSYRFLFWICLIIAVIGFMVTMITVEEPRKAIIAENN